MDLKQGDIEKINELLIKIANPYITYIFGSASKGTMKDDSDIDIAFLSDREFMDYEVFMLAQELAAVLGRDVDLVNIHKASTVFKAQIVGTGKVIFCNNDIRRMYFEMYALKDYALLNEERVHVLEAIEKRGNIYG